MALDAPLNPNGLYMICNELYVIEYKFKKLSIFIC